MLWRQSLAWIFSTLDFGDVFKRASVLQHNVLPAGAPLIWMHRLVGSNKWEDHLALKHTHWDTSMQPDTREQ